MSHVSACTTRTRSALEPCSDRGAQQRAQPIVRRDVKVCLRTHLRMLAYPVLSVQSTACTCIIVQWVLAVVFDSNSICGWQDSGLDVGQ